MATPVQTPVTKRGFTSVWHVSSTLWRSRADVTGRWEACKIETNSLSRIESLGLCLLLLVLRVPRSQTIQPTVKPVLQSLFLCRGGSFLVHLCPG